MDFRAARGQYCLANLCTLVDEAEGLLIVTGPGIGREAVVIATGLVLYLLPCGPLIALGALVPFYIVMKIDHDFEVFIASQGIIFLCTFSFL